MKNNHIIKLFDKIFPDKSLGMGLHQPLFHGNEWKYVKECLDTGWVSSVGKYVDKFEQDLAKFTGAKHAIVTCNGTAALHMCFILAGIQPNDEVLVPTLTFVATCNAIKYCDATPHFVDSNESNLGVDADKLEKYLEQIVEIKNKACYNKKTGKPIRALCVMHVFGHPVDLDILQQICDKFYLTLIEDAAEALGSCYKGNHVGHYGLVGALSFNGNKTMTTGGGGAILTDNDEVASCAKHLTTTAKTPHPWLYQYDEVGYNYRMPNINAALGCAQLEQIPHFLEAKRNLAANYSEAFNNNTEIKFLIEPDYAKSNYWLNAIILDKQYANQRDCLLENFNNHGFGVRPIWELMHTLPMYRDCPKMDLTIAESLASRTINIPSSVILGEAHAYS